MLCIDSESKSVGIDQLLVAGNPVGVRRQLTGICTGGTYAVCIGLWREGALVSIKSPFHWINNPT
jgi:hypothetical protein